jgi:hypothetical protein
MEGFYKITHAEKIAYVTQYQARATNVVAVVPVDEPPLSRPARIVPMHAAAHRGWRRSTRCNVRLRCPRARPQRTSYIPVPFLPVRKEFHSK